MSIKYLKVENIRNIAVAELDFSRHFNLISGANGSGKSTLLEAIYMIARARSYRSNRFGSVVKSGERQLNVFAKTENKQQHSIGVEKTPSTTKIRVDGNNVLRVSEIARITPLQIITPMSHEILDRGPEYRKRFVEWGVFHVEHEYFDIYKRFFRALRQRNALLKKNQKLASWNNILGEAGEKVDDVRSNYVRELSRHIKTECHNLSFNQSVEIAWKAGWDRSESLESVLSASTKSDFTRGFTQHGPQRADLRIMVEGQNVGQIFSRGQQKMLIAAMHLAQGALLKEKTGYSPIILIDDLISELDRENREKILKRLLDHQFQIFTTSIEPIEAFSVSGAERRDFHIHKGSVGIKTV
ncbi:MAG: DNA replication/repair protein RecF [Sedimenticola thiotaurini]|uniref:DNA replication and repair protein RecF n=1 Tax=Sedimenticola thiotaurini TaxID=1543721 RepID=A0A558DFD9_9GAMM|nr:MAG: DNA replication/repair protein RecF [Sedimenticola thiotaurini]